ncbi:hypothetical protein Tco_0448914 [Tanacetum coccineum]
MQANELYKFSDGTLKTVRDELYHRIRDFRLGYNEEMSRRKWTATDKRRSEIMVELIDKQMRERRIIRNLERLVGARELEIDYKLMTRITRTELTLEQTQQGVSDEVLVSIEGVKELKRNVKIKDNHHGPSDAMHNPSQPLKVSQKTLVSFLTEIKAFLSTFSLRDS